MAYEKVLVDLTRNMFVILTSNIVSSVTTLRADIKCDVVASECHGSANAAVVLCRLDIHSFPQLSFELSKRLHARPVLDSFPPSIQLVAVLFVVIQPESFM